LSPRLLSRASAVAASSAVVGAAAVAVSDAEKAASERAALERKLADLETNLLALKQMQIDFAPMYEMTPALGEKARSDIVAHEKLVDAARQALVDHERRVKAELEHAAENRVKLEARESEAAESLAAKKKTESDRAAADAAERERLRKLREDNERQERERLERELAERERKLAEQREREEKLLLDREAAKAEAQKAERAQSPRESAVVASSRTSSSAAPTDGALASPRPVRAALSESASGSKYAPLLELLPGSSLLVINAMCVAGGASVEPDVLGAVCCALDGHGMLQDAVASGIATEAAETSNAGTLFRSNTPATKLLGAYTRLAGTAYLIDLLRPLIGELMASGDDLEVDPTKCTEAEAQTHQPLLRSWAERFLSAVFDSLPSCPTALRWMCARVVGASVERFADSKVSSAGGFLFLRFICPALMTPKARGVLKIDPPPLTQRNLLLVSKLLQNLANNVEFKKEPFMMPLNSFVTDKQADMASFFDKFVAVDLAARSEQALSTAADADAVHLPYVHAFVAKHVDKVKQSLVAYKQTAAAEAVDKALAALGAVGDARVLDTYGSKATPPAAAAAVAVASSSSPPPSVATRVAPVPPSAASALSPRAGVASPPLSPRTRRAVGPDVDVGAGLVIRVVFELPTGERATKSVHAEFSTTVAALMDMVCAKFDLASLAENLELFVSTPIDSVLKLDKTLNAYHFLSKSDVVVELRWRAGTPSWARYQTLEASKGLPAASRVRELKIRKMLLAGLVAKRDTTAAAAKVEMAALDELLRTLDDTTRTMITKPIDRGTRRRAQTTLSDDASADASAADVVSPRLSASTDSFDPAPPPTRSNSIAAGVSPPKRPSSPPPAPRPTNALATPARASTLKPQTAASPPRAADADAAPGAGFGGLLARAQQMRRAEPSKAAPPAAEEKPEAPPDDPPLSQSTLVAPLSPRGGSNPAASPPRAMPPRPVDRPNPAPPVAARTTRPAEPSDAPARSTPPRPVPRPPARIPRQDSSSSAVLPAARIERRKTPPGPLSAPPPLLGGAAPAVVAKPNKPLVAESLDKPPALAAPASLTQRPPPLSAPPKLSAPPQLSPPPARRSVAPPPEPPEPARAPREPREPASAPPGEPPETPREPSEPTEEADSLLPPDEPSED
jgi:hypothetical protein